MGKYSEMLQEKEGGKYTQMLQEQPEQGDFKKHFPAYKVPEKGYKPQAIWNPEAVKKTQPQSLIGVADASGQPDDYYASIGNAKFFSEKFLINPDDALKRSLSIGRAIYQNDSLTDYQINKLIDEDLKNGSFELRASNAKWTQYGLSDTEAQAMNEIYESDWADNLEFAASIPAGGLAKAFFGTVSGAGDMVGIDTPFSDDLVSEIEGFQQDHLNKALLSGDYTTYGMGMVGKTAGDIYGNLKLMGQAIKAANLWTGGSLSLTAKGKTLSDIAKSTSKKALFLSGLNYIRTPGTHGEKAKAFGVTMAYMNTPILSSMSPTHFSAFFSDFLLNSGITVTTGQYKDVWNESQEIAEAMGQPDDAKRIFIAKAIPLLGSDLAFSALTRSTKQNRQTELLKSYVETSRVLEQKGAVSVQEFEGALQKKYGDGWDQSMTEADRTKYNALKTANDAVKSGGLSEESLQTAPIDTQARIQIENDKVYYRDKDGTLRDIEGKEPQPIMDKIEFAKEETVTPLPKEETIISPTNKGLLGEPPPKEFAPEMSDALAGLEKAMNSHKGTEVITTDADIGKGVIAESPRLGQKDSVELTPPNLKSKNFEPWLTEQIVHISRLMEMGQIKTKKQYNEYLDTYTQRGDMDKDMVYKEAKAHQKEVGKLMKDAEKKSAKAKITQKQFKQPRQMVLMDSMQVIKDRIRSMQEAAKDGKRLGVTEEKAKQELRRAKETAKLKDMNEAQMARHKERIAGLEERHKQAKADIKAKNKERADGIKEIVDYGIKVVNDITKDADIRNKFKVKAQKLKTEKGLASFLGDLNRFIEKDSDTKLRNHYIGKITKPISGSTSYEQAKALKEIQQSVLIPKGEKAQVELDRVAQFLKDNPDAKLPPKLLSKLDKTSFNKLETDDLKVIADEVDRLRKQGNVKFQLEHKQRKDQSQVNAEAITSTMKAPKPEKVQDIGGKQKSKPSIKFSGTRPDRFFDMLDGAKGAFKGLAHSIFIDKTRDARAKFNEMKDARLSGGERLVKDLGMRVKDFNKKITISVDGKPTKLTMEQMMGVYAGSKNRLNRAAILHGNFKGDEAAMQKVIDMVENDGRLKTVADYIIYDFANNTGRVFDSVGRNEGKVLDLEEYYIPMRRSDIQQKTSVDDMHHDVVGRSDIIKQLPDSKFKISRQEVPDSLQKGVDINLMSLWEREVGLQEHYISQMGNVKQMRGVLESGKFADNLKKSYGENAPKYVSDFIDVVANPMSIYQHDGLSKVSRRLRKNIATAYLAGNVKTMIKQFPSLALYSGEASPARLANSLAEVTGAFDVVDGKSRNTILDFVSEKDPLIKHSHIQRELDELRLSDKNKYDQFMDKVGEEGFQGILAIDRLARSAGWYAVYKKAIEGGKSEDEAVRLARNATARTQPTAAAEELPPIYRKNESLNWMLMFSNQLNQIYNMATKDVPNRILRGGKDEKIAGIAEAGGLAMSALTIWAINNGRLPESPEDVKDAMSENAMASIPLVGSHLVNGYHGYDSALPINEFVNETGGMIAKTEEGDMTMEELANYAWRNVAPSFGIPVVALGRAGEAMEEGDPMKLTGIKKKEPKKKKTSKRGGSSRGGSSR